MVSPAGVRNYWPDAKCAKAFWSQQEVRPYRRLLADTLDWAAPAAGERWLDLGCGSGPLSAGLWERSHGKIAEVIGLDCRGGELPGVREPPRDAGAAAEGSRALHPPRLQPGAGTPVELVVRPLRLGTLDHLRGIVVGEGTALDR